MLRLRVLVGLGEALGGACARLGHLRPRDPTLRVRLRVVVEAELGGSHLLQVVATVVYHLLSLIALCALTPLLPVAARLDRGKVLA